MTSYLFFKMAKSTSGCGFSDGTRLRRSKSICIPNFDEISQFTVELLLLPVSENKRPQYCNSTSGLQSDRIRHFGILPFMISQSFVKM